MECIANVDKRAKHLDNIHLFIQQILMAHLQGGSEVGSIRHQDIELDKVPDLKEFTLYVEKVERQTVNKETSNILMLTWQNYLKKLFTQNPSILNYYNI